MSTNNPTENKPDLQDKVNAAKDRLAERTDGPTPAQRAKTLIEEHPVASLAAGILLGALIAKALPSSGRVRKSAAGLASIAGKLAVDYATKAADAGREGLHKVEEVGGKLADAGGSLGGKIADGSGDARRKAGDLAEIARSAAAEASEIAIRKVTEFASRMKH